MNIIIEGADCSGKSTLIEQQFSDYCVIHNGVYPSPDLAFKAYMGQIPSPKRNFNNIVWDRMFISEQIYGPIYRNGGLSPLQVFELHEKLKAIQTIIILCDPGDKVLLETWRSRKSEEYITDEESYMEIVEGYRMLRAVTDLPVILYDWTNTEYNKRHPLTWRIGEIRLRLYSHG